MIAWILKIINTIVDDMNNFQIVIIIGATGFFMTAMLFLAARRIPQENKGTGWWAIASIAACVSYIGVFLTTLNGLETVGRVLNSVLMVVWVVALHFGGAEFNNRKANWQYMMIAALITIISILYFNFVLRNIILSAIITQLFCSVILFRLALIFFKNKVHDSFLNKALVVTFIICGMDWQSYVLTFVYEPYQIPGFFIYAIILFAIHFFLALLVIEQFHNRIIQSEQDAVKAANHDFLTGLPNRLFLNAQFKYGLARSMRENTEMALLFIDLDKFKPINDEFGHKAGDQVLIETAKRLKSIVREEDIVARLGGDEFLILLNKSSMDSKEVIAKIARKIIKIVNEPIFISDTQVGVGASIGIVFCPSQADTLEKLTHMADEVMYEVKSQGRNGFRFVNE